MSSISRIIQTFIAEHPEELVDGKLKVCIGGGAGFIGSHIAKQLKSDVSFATSLSVPPMNRSKSFDCFAFHFIRVATLFVLIGKTTSLCSPRSFAMNSTR